MDRATMLSRLTTAGEPWDIVVVGGGATGVGVALDAASRGYRVALVEQQDFGKGTSGRSTKLVHGGVRYLEQGNISLVMEALRERGILKENAPHLVRELAFVVPNYEWWEAPFYGIGLRLYDLLAGKYGFGPSHNLSADETLGRLPTLRQDGLRGGVVYYDGQFDDTRLLMHMVITAFEQGAVLVNYCPAVALRRGHDGLLCGIRIRDGETGREHDVAARAVVNAAGAFCDGVRRLADPGATPLIQPSQGIHLVFERSFLAGDSAIMVPHTRDGRVMFAIPWHGHTLVGTTDTPVSSVSIEPQPMEQEVDFILETARLYLDRAPSRADILSAWAGIRPLVGVGSAASTAALSRDHTIHIDHSGLVSIAGGKWTTYRHMAEDCVNQVALIAGLPERPCVTRYLRIHGYHHHADRFGHLDVYGSDALAIQEMIASDGTLSRRLHPALPYIAAEVVWAARSEMARTVEDVLSRRIRALMLNAGAALEMAPEVALLLADALELDSAWCDSQVREFSALARRYLLQEGDSC